MKKALAIFAVLLFAGLTQAQDYYWYLTWMIGGAYAPGTEAPVLDSYDVTWSLLGDTENGTILIDEYTPLKGTGATSETWFGHALFDNYLSANTDATYTKLSENGNITADVYQRVIASNGTDTYQWESDKLTLSTVSEFKGASLAPGSDVIIGDDVAWTKVTDPTSVPEPATMSLLGLGALAMVLRRKVRK